MRKSLEQCDVQEDIEHFVNLRRTGDKPPGMTLGILVYNTVPLTRSTLTKEGSYQTTHNTLSSAASV